MNNGRPGFRRRARWRDPILALRLRIGDKATRFRALHEAPGAFVMPNPWDAGSARIPAGLGFRALALNGFMQV